MQEPAPSIPEGLDLLPEAGGFIVRRSWRNWGLIPMGLFAVIWDGFLFFFYSKILLTQPHAPLPLLLFPSLHLAVGVGLTYFVLASLVNHTDVVVTPAGVRVHTGPAPWPGNCVVGVEEITDVKVRERSRNRGRSSYSVMYVDQNRKERRLVSTLAEFDQADFIERVIRQVLRLPAKDALE